MNVATLITCHNRREKTIRCIEALLRSSSEAGCALDVVVVDDGSSDGTTDAVREHFPFVHIVPGDGTLFWNRGMYRAFQWALGRYDFYLWLNDDTLLERDALQRLLLTENVVRRMNVGAPIIVGTTADPDTGEPTYGGRRRSSPWRPLRFDLVRPAEEPLRCETMNGNIALISADVASKVGNLDYNFAHAMGDFDYGLRATKMGCGVWVAPGILGCCAIKISEKNVEGSSLRSRLQKMQSTKHLPPRAWKIFVQRHAGPLWPLYWIWPYLKVLAER